MSAYSDAVLALSPLWYLQMDETSGTLIDNTGSGGNTYDGTISGTYTLGQQGVVHDGGLSINLNGGSIQLANAVPLTTPDDWWVCGWVKRTPSAASQPLWGQGDETGQGYMYIRFQGTTGRLAVCVGDASFADSGASHTYQDSAAHFVAVNFDHGSTKYATAWVDGVKVIDAAVFPSGYSGTHNAEWIGKDKFGNTLIGNVDHVARRKGALLTDQNVADLYALGLTQGLAIESRWELLAYQAQQAALESRWALDAYSGLLRIDSSWSLQGNPVLTPTITAVHYTLMLTGADDELPDLVMPMSSFSARRKNGEPSYLSVIVPAVADYVDGIAARPNGELVIERGDRYTDGSTVLSEIARANLEDIRYDQGPMSYSGTLTGHKTITYGSPATVALVAASYRAIYGGKRRLRGAIDNALKPGDTVTWGTDSFTAGEISYTVGPSTAVMEVAEA